MTMAKITLPIRYWDQGPTRRITATDKNSRTIEAAYFNFVKFTGLSKHYPLPLLYSYQTKKLYLPLREKFMSLNRGTVYEDGDMSYEIEHGSLGKHVTFQCFTLCITWQTTIILYMIPCHIFMHTSTKRRFILT